MQEVLTTVITLTLAATIILDSGLFLFIAFKQKTNTLRTLLLIHLAGILGWALSTLLVLRFEHPAAAQWAFATALILSVAKFFFILIFPQKSLPIFSYHYLIFIPSIIALILIFIPGAVFLSATVVDGYYVVITDGPYAPFYALTVAYLLLYPILILFRKYKETSYPHIIHKQIKYLLYGTSLFFIIGLLTNSILPVFFNIYFFNGLGPVFSLILAGFIVYIISKYDFLGLKTIIQRGLVYSILFTIIIGAYTLSVHALMALFGTASNNTTITFLGAGLTTALGIVSVPYIDKYLRKKTARWFFKDTYDYAQALKALSESLHKSPRLRDITDHITSELQDIFHATSVTISLNISDTLSTQVYLSNDAYTLVAPIVYEQKHIAHITLGEKKSGDTYTTEDVQLMQTFAYHIAVALERVRLFKEVEMYSKELEAKVSERTAKLEASQQAQQHMMEDISHSLQTPLTIIKSEIEYLRKHSPHPDKIEVFERSIDDISSFIYNLLRLTHIESSNNDMRIKQINLSTMTEEIVEYFTPSAALSDIAVHHTIAPDIQISGDTKKLEELLLILLSNAEKYTRPMPKKKITITLAVHDTTPTLTVTDTGIGISAEDLPHIFERFRRSQNTTRHNIAGSGLGLAIAKSIADKHHATLTVTSTEDTGTTFTVAFPPCHTHA